MPDSNGTTPVGPILDPRILDSLRVELGSDGAAVIADVLATFGSETLAQLQRCQQAGTATDLAKAAHRLRGSALNVGAVALAAICAKAESAGHGGDLATGQACLPEMAKLLAATVTALGQAKA